ncbi:MAG: PASTA domain-containing protein [Acidobacteriota bacterium]
MRRWLRFFGLAAYAVLVLVVFLLTGYLSFSGFVRSGVTGTPELTGMTDSEAVALLSDHGLRLKEREGEEAFDEQVAPGRVLRQRPHAGSPVKRGSVVEVVFSRGPQRLQVPDLLGQAVQSAQVALAAVGLPAGRTLSVWSDRQTPGLVTLQNPPPGSLVDRETPIDLFVSVGDSAETYVMPDLIYRGYDEVKTFFDRGGFRLGSVKFEAYEGVARGVVLRQFPLPGHPVRRQDSIALVVAAGAGEGS